MSLSVANFVAMTTGHGFCPSPQPIALMAISNGSFRPRGDSYSNAGLLAPPRLRYSKFAESVQCIPGPGG